MKGQASLMLLYYFSSLDPSLFDIRLKLASLSNPAIDVGSASMAQLANVCLMERDLH